MTSLLSTKDEELEVAPIFGYRPLPTHRKPFRVLILLPGRPKDTIECHLKHVFLDDEPEYEALSYTWGDDKLPKQLIRCDGGKLGILPNLYDALRHFRKPKVKRVIWADAICINQTDFPEKNIQVQLMRDIYKQARGVLVWVGREADNSSLGVDLVQTVGRLLLNMLPNGVLDPFGDNARIVRQIVDKLPETDDDAWCALRELIKRPWFTRVWIIQELTLASQVEVHCGPSVFMWEELCCVIQFSIQVGFIEAASDSGSSSIPSLNVTRRRTQAGEKRSLLSLLLQFPSFQATNPRDKLYALLGLSDANVIPRYEVPYPEVFRDVVMEIIQSSRNLDILSFPPEGPVRHGSSTSTPRDKLPSWVPNFVYRTQRIQQFTLQDFDNPLYDTPKFHAAGPHIEFVPAPSSDRNILQLEGHSIDTIKQVGIALPPHKTPETFGEKMKLLCNTHLCHLSWERTAGLFSREQYPNKCSPSPENMIDAYWQTLQGGYSPLGKPYHRNFYLEFNKSWSLYRWLHEKNIPCINAMLVYFMYLVARELGQGRGFNPMRIWNMLDGMPVESTERKFFGFCKAVVNRRLLRSEKGYIGLAPRGAAKGDLIAVVKGSKIPLLLRPASGSAGVGDLQIPFHVRTAGISADTIKGELSKGFPAEKGGSEPETWKLVGDTYVHGVMFGEAWDDRLSQSLCLA